MNILYIIGNGFDVAQGLHTKYGEFEKYYQGLPSQLPIIGKFKKDIKPDSDLWSDLELALGKYVSETKNSEEFDTIYYDVLQQLEEYLTMQESMYKTNQSEIERFIHNAQHPELFLEPADAKVIGDVKHSLIKLPWDVVRINAISLNYTNVFEKALGFDIRDANNLPEATPYLGEICYIHGKLNQANPIIMGVDNESQVRLKSPTQSSIFSYLIKPIANESIRSIAPLNGESLISTADLIVLFGVSIGKTDSTWWKFIVSEMRKREQLRLIVFHYAGIKQDKYRKAQWMSQYTNLCKQTFYKRTQMTDDSVIGEVEIDNILSRIIVAIDKDIFAPKMGK